MTMPALLGPADSKLTTTIGKTSPAKAISPVQGVTPAPTAPSTTPIDPVPGAKPAITQTMRFRGKLTNGAKMMPQPYGQMATTKKLAGVNAANSLLALLDASLVVKQYQTKRATGNTEKPDITERLAMAVLCKHAKTMVPRMGG